MKKVFGIIITLLFLLISLQQVLIIVHFKLNQNEIEQEFCINKTKPELKCHGKCHLKKELEKSDNTNLRFTIVEKKIDFIITSNVEFIIKILKNIKSNKIINYKEFGQLEPYIEIFIPPPILLSFISNQ